MIKFSTLPMLFWLMLQLHRRCLIFIEYQQAMRRGRECVNVVGCH